MVQRLPVEVISLDSAATDVYRAATRGSAAGGGGGGGGGKEERKIPSSLPFSQDSSSSFPFLSSVGSPHPSPLSRARARFPAPPLASCAGTGFRNGTKTTARKYTRPKRMDLTCTRSNWISSFYFSHSPPFPLPLFIPASLSLFLHLVLFLCSTSSERKGRERKGRLDSRL